MSADVDADRRRRSRFTAGGSTVDVSTAIPAPRASTRPSSSTWHESGVADAAEHLLRGRRSRLVGERASRTYDGTSDARRLDRRTRPVPAQRRSEPPSPATSISRDRRSRSSAGSPNLQLQPFLPPAACKNATSKYVLDIRRYDHVDIPNDAHVRVRLRDRRRCSTPTTCTPVTDPQAFVYSAGRSRRPGIVGINVAGDIDASRRALATSTPPDVRSTSTAKSAGSTTLHVTARQRSTGQGRRDRRHSRHRGLVSVPS